MTGTGTSWFRPDYSLFGTETDGTGLFGYKNFSAHFLSVTGFFLCAWSMASPKNGESICSRGFCLWLLPSHAAPAPLF